MVHSYINGAVQLGRNSFKVLAWGHGALPAAVRGRGGEMKERQWDGQNRGGLGGAQG